MTRATIVLACAVGLSSGLAGRPAAPVQGAAVAGALVAADTGTPVRRAIVTLLFGGRDAAETNLLVDRREDVAGGGLPPGEDLLAAVDGVETAEQFDPEFLQRLAPGAQRVTLDAGAATVVNLHVR